jgi:hypothetical protein
VDKIAVLARAFKGEPLVRVIIYSQGSMAYLARPESVDAVKSGDSIPIGFPLSDIYQFNTDTYDVLRTEWDQSGGVSRETWERIPLVVDKS